MFMAKGNENEQVLTIYCSICTQLSLTHSVPAVVSVKTGMQLTHDHIAPLQ